MTPELIAGRYRVVRAIGHGGMGAVWLCRDEVLGREVAVKQIGVLPGESAPDAARALREARSSAALNHRNVVSVFDVVDDDSGHAWLVMEYVPSRTLGDVVRDDGPLDPRRAAFIGGQVADGLAAAHAAGTIHRDVKPGNILVGEDDAVKVTDFGIARRQGEDQLTRSGLVTGTPSYFSPELARGADPGPEADVYALGATLYLAVEGRPPYPEERNPIALLQRIAAEEPPPPERAGPLAGALSRMMDRDPGVRWTMAEAADRLHRVADQGAEPPAATAPITAVAAEPVLDDEPNRRRSAPWLVAAAVLMLVALGTGIMAMTEDTEEPEPVAGGAQTGSPSPSPTTAAPRTRSSTPSPTPAPTPPEPTPSTSPERETPAPVQEPRPTDEGAENSGGSAVGVVEEYFALMPANTDAGWERLAPRMQRETGRGSYESWWRSVEEVELHSAQAVDGEPEVEVDLTYFFADGTAQRETQLLTLERSDGEWLIADDEVLSSRSA